MEALYQGTTDFIRMSGNYWNAEGTAGRQMLLSNLLITTLWLVIPVTVVYAAMPLCGSASAVVENWKGEFISEDVLVDDLMVEQADELISTPDELDEMISTPEELISTLDEPGDLTAPPEIDDRDDLTVDAPDLIVDETEE